ncbi:MAG TPA: carboxypeptidase-like regulatory domain-containing protein [Verrucomicrobiales bacterium]|nr:carboxypeptidase-like regulatory domain-containing protein [Verrucomicrobiales bacterium]
MKTALPLTIAFAGMSLNACIAPPGRLVRTPEITGRVVDSRTKAPLEGATLRFLQDDKRTPFDPPRAVATDAAGRFRVRPTYYYYLTGLVLGHSGVYMFPSVKDRASYVLFQHPGFEPKILDISDASRAARVVKENHPVALGDVALKK